MADTSTQTQLEDTLDKKLSAIEQARQEKDYQEKAASLGLGFVNFMTTPVDTDALAVIDEKEARAASIAPFSKTGSRLAVAVIDADNETTTLALKKLSAQGYAIKTVMTSPHGLEIALSRYKNIRKVEVFELGAIDISEKELANFQGQIKNITDLKDKVTQISTTRILEVLIAGALKIGASDIHFEPERESARLRYRMDGVLADVTKLKNEDYLKIVSRIKVLSKLKLNVHAAAQDGRFTIRQESVAIEVRVSILPSEYGETIVMRLLDPRKIKQNLDELGIREDLLALIKEQLSRANGALLTTGPTGSGKTTSLYAFINYLNTADTKIITIEDPIEYHIAGISQTQVDPAKDYTFANGLRAIVRQDPDIILVGEIRDTETAEIALNAALTGHIVLSTIHTNDAAGTIPRLIDLGVPSQTIAPAVNMAMAQRLVRRLCVKCRQEITVTAELYEKIIAQLGPIKDKLDIQGISPTMKVSFPGKCAECNETGYKGRVGVYEAFIISREIEKMILGNPSTSDIQDQAIKDGMTTMLQDAYMKLVAGITSIEEIERIL